MQIAAAVADLAAAEAATASALQEQLALKDTGVRAALALQDKVVEEAEALEKQRRQRPLLVEEAEALEKQLPLQDIPVREARALQDQIGLEAEALQAQLGKRNKYDVAKEADKQVAALQEDTLKHTAATHTLKDSAGKAKSADILKDTPLKDTPVKEPLPLEDQIKLETEALEEHAALEDSAVNEALALQDQIAKEAEARQEQLPLQDTAAKEPEGLLKEQLPLQDPAAPLPLRRRSQARGSGGSIRSRVMSVVSVLLGVLSCCAPAHGFLVPYGALHSTSFTHQILSSSAPPAVPLEHTESADRVWSTEIDRSTEIPHTVPLEHTLQAPEASGKASQEPLSQIGREIGREAVSLSSPQPLSQIVISNICSPEDERVWVPQGESLWFRPLCLSVSSGYYVNLLRFKGAGVLGCHRHSSPVHAHTIAGQWGYKEHSWTAGPGTYVFEPPGETHTLVVKESCDLMITLFHVTGSLLYVDPETGAVTGFDDVFTKLEKARKWYEECGLGRDYVEQFVR